MNTNTEVNNLSGVWMAAINMVIEAGVEVSPRGMDTMEVPQGTINVNMRMPVLTIPSRNLSYQFMAAEAYWILEGDNRVETIIPWCPQLAEYSDNGSTFFGAYGPRIKSQVDYVVDKLILDTTTRQAGLTIWKENPPETKDFPCTIAMFFSIRDSMLNANVFMRSSDLWLGMPYDAFNFSMISHFICCRLNKELVDPISPGFLYITAASMHVYMRDMRAIHTCMTTVREENLVQPLTPEDMFMEEDLLFGTLGGLRDSMKGSLLRWWEK